MFNVKMKWWELLSVLIGSTIASACFSVVVTFISIAILGFWSWDVAHVTFVIVFVINVLYAVRQIGRHGFKGAMKKIGEIE